MDVARVKRVNPLIVAALVVVLLVGGVLWKARDLEKCTDEGGLPIAPMSRNQDCERGR